MFDAYRELDEAARFIKGAVDRGITLPKLSIAQPRLEECFEEGGPEALADGPILESLAPTQAMYKVGLDGGSRRVGCDYALEVIATVAVCARGFYPLVDYPPAPLDYPVSVAQTFEWIGLLPHFDVEADAAPNPNVKLFEKDCYAEQVYEELRLGLETRVLDGVVPSIIDSSLDMGESPLIILDGPIYGVPARGFFKRAEGDGAGRLKRYGKWYEGHVKERIEIIERYLRRGVPVVSVVKRLGKSWYLKRFPAIKDFLRRRGLDPGVFANDGALVHELFRLGLSEGLLPAVCVSTAPMKVDLSYVVKDPAGGFMKDFRELSYLLERNPKVFVYAGVLAHPLSSDYVQTFRIETLESVYNKYGGAVFKEVMGDAALQGSPLPISIVSSDARCREWGEILFKYSVEGFMKHHLPLDYETRVGLMSQ